MPNNLPKINKYSSFEKESYDDYTEKPIDFEGFAEYIGTDVSYLRDKMQSLDRQQVQLSAKENQLKNEKDRLITEASELGVTCGTAEEQFLNELKKDEDYPIEQIGELDDMIPDDFPGLEAEIQQLDDVRNSVSEDDIQKRSNEIAAGFYYNDWDSQQELFDIKEKCDEADPELESKDIADRLMDNQRKFDTYVQSIYDSDMFDEKTKSVIKLEYMGTKRQMMEAADELLEKKDQGALGKVREALGQFQSMQIMVAGKIEKIARDKAENEVPGYKQAKDDLHKKKREIFQKMLKDKGLEEDYQKAVQLRNQYDAKRERQNQIDLELQDTHRSLTQVVDQNRHLNGMIQNSYVVSEKQMAMTYKSNYPGNQADPNEADSLKDYMQELEVITKQLKKSDRIGSKQEFRDMLKTAEEQLKNLKEDKPLNMRKVVRAFSQLDKAAEAYREKHQPKPDQVLYGQQPNRLKLCNRIHMISSWARQGVVRTMDKEGLKLKIAEKLVHGDGRANFLANAKDAEVMSAHFYDKNKVMSQIAALADNKVFDNFINSLMKSNPEDPLKPLQDLMRMPGLKAREVYARAEMRFMAPEAGGQTVQTGNNVPVGNNLTVQDKSAPNLQGKGLNADPQPQSGPVTGF